MGGGEIYFFSQQATMDHDIYKPSPQGRTLYV